jgi:hypothetical protein
VSAFPGRSARFERTRSMRVVGRRM